MFYENFDIINNTIFISARIYIMLTDNDLELNQNH
jgi:hypothetical protein